MCAQHRAILPPTGSQWEGTQNGCHRNRLARRRPGGLPHRRGGPVEDRNVDNTPAGHRRLIDWAHRGRAGRVAIEGSGNDGRPAALALLAAGIEVVEVPPQMTARARRRQRSNTKTGRVDATSQISDLVADTATTLTDIHGIGALTAADTLAEVGDPARFATKAKFAMANGTAPLQAGSGRIVGHRLNRGANRQLNRAIHTAAITQIARNHSEGRRLYEHHLNRGKTKREAIRALKRRISDRIWTHLQHHPTDPQLAPSLT